MDNNELPIGKPPIACYLHHVYPLTAAMLHKDFDSWLYSNYIQLQYCLANDTLNFFTYVICGNSVYIPIIDYKILDQEFLFMNHINIFDLIVNSIDMGYYVTTYADEFFVPERNSYKSWHTRHEIMVFGYNLKEKFLKIIGYNNKGVYSKSTISFFEFEQSYISTISKKNDVISFKAKDNMSYQSSFEFDVKNVKDLLQDYLFSRDTCDRLRIFGNPQSGLVYGIQIYKEIIKYCQSVITNNKDKCDRRILHLLWEHKKVMVSRIEYLTKYGYINNSTELLNIYNELKETALLLRNKFLKYNASNNKMLIETTIDSLDLMYSQEKDAIEDLLDKLVI